jgi:hypothetical protein
VVSMYCHLSRFRVKSGDFVKKGANYRWGWLKRTSHRSSPSFWYIFKWSLCKSKAIYRFLTDLYKYRSNFGKGQF